MQKRKSQEDSVYIHPIFNPEKAGNLVLTPEDFTAVIDEQECRIYNFRLEDERTMEPGKPKHIVEECRRIHGEIHLR